MKNTYTFSFIETCIGFAHVRADSHEEAEDKARKLLEDATGSEYNGFGTITTKKIEVTDLDFKECEPGNADDHAKD